MRALWTAATGMKSQQFNIDTISNNLANVNTTSYKVKRAEFNDLFYANIKKANVTEDGGKPVNLEVGHGVMAVATKSDFRVGSFMETQGTFDFAINGEGFFAVEMPNGEMRYTRDGSFKLSVDGDEASLVTSDGYYVMSEDEDLITIDRELKDITVNEMGYIYGEDADGESVEMGRLMISSFMNPQGLKAEGQNLYSTTQASGEATLLEAEEMDTKIVQGYLETSNVQVVDEMVKMITAQRAYEINSKTISTADEMMQLANNLKR